jgi:site-specific DNA-cytosine methylase
LAHGISTDAMAAQDIGINVVGGSEVDSNLATAFSKRTGAKSYPGLIELIEAGKRGEYPELHDLDIVTSGVPCPYRSNAGSLSSNQGKMEREAGAERHLSTRQVDFFKVFKPRTAMIEQPAPSQPHMHEYTEVVEEMQRCGYNTTQKVLNCAEHGDKTCRRRWFLMCTRYTCVPEWPEPMKEFKMPDGVLDDMKTVCPARYVQKGTATFVPRLPKAALPPRRSAPHPLVPASALRRRVGT